MLWTTAKQDVRQVDVEGRVMRTLWQSSRLCGMWIISL
jgi:hypothetical protein